jgi:acetyl-CoA carboxylase biotin carboxyl carrier protein
LLLNNKNYPENAIKINKLCGFLMKTVFIGRKYSSELNWRLRHENACNLVIVGYTDRLTQEKVDTSCRKTVYYSLGKKTMELKKVKELIDVMKENDLVELEVVDGDSKIHLKRPGSAAPIVTQVPMSAPVVAPAPANASAPAPENDNLVKITSPIVGTFYQASSPDAAPYVKVGDKVTPDAVVCIIEAMKVMNEIKAEASGTVVEVLCKDGQAVEFGQVLFKLRP